MTEVVRVLSLQDREEWEAEHARDGLPSQSWCFANALAASGWSPRLAVVEGRGGRLLLPHVQRDWHGRVDIATLPGLSGASFTGDSGVWSVWREYAEAQGWIAGYVQLATSITPDAALLPETVLHDNVFVLDPRGWSAARSASLIIRRKIGAATRQGARVVLDRGALAEEFPALYLGLMRRFGRSAEPAATVRAWAECPSTLLVGAELDGRIELVHAIHTSAAVAELHLVGSTERGRALSALVFGAAIEQLGRRGVARFDLGGAGDEGGGLYQFKSWLGGAAVPLNALHQVYDPAGYAALCAESGVEAGTSWFPAYRARRTALP